MASPVRCVRLLPLLALAAAAWPGPAAAEALCIDYKLTPAAGTSLPIAQEELRRQLADVGALMSRLFGSAFTLDRCGAGSSAIPIATMEGRIALAPNRQLYVYRGDFSIVRPAQDPHWARVTFSWHVSFTRNNSCARTPDALAIASALIDYQRGKRRAIPPLTREKLGNWAVPRCSNETPKPPSYDMLLERLERLEELEGAS